MTSRFGVFKRKVIRAGNLAGREPVFSYILAPDFGTHPTREAARRACMETFDPELIGSPDAHIRAHYDAMTRNLKYYKVSAL